MNIDKAYANLTPWRGLYDSDAACVSAHFSSQAKAAEWLGVGESTLSGWIKDRCNGTDKPLLRFALVALEVENKASADFLRAHTADIQGLLNLLTSRGFDLA